MRAGLETAPEQRRLGLGRGGDAKGCNRETSGDCHVTPEGRKTRDKFMLRSVIELARDTPGIWCLCQVREVRRDDDGILMRAALAANVAPQMIALYSLP